MINPILKIPVLTISPGMNFVIVLVPRRRLARR